MIVPKVREVAQDKTLLWFGYWSEVIAFIILMMILFANFVESAPYSPLGKALIIILGVFIVYDVFKPFVHTNYVLIKEN